jgi:uncharacterized protein YegL
LYFLVDASGSTVRDGFNAGWNLVLPRLISAAEEDPDHQVRVCVFSYGTEAVVRIGLTPAGQVSVIPTLIAGGLSSLAAGLRLAASTIDVDWHQLDVDGVTADPPMVWVVADDLSTDSGADLLAARETLAAAAGPPVLHVAVPDEVDELSVAGLRAVRHPVAVGDAEQVADSIESAVRSVLGLRDAPVG